MQSFILRAYIIAFTVFETTDECYLSQCNETFADSFVLMFNTVFITFYYCNICLYNIYLMKFGAIQPANINICITSLNHEMYKRNDSIFYIIIFAF